MSIGMKLPQILAAVLFATAAGSAWATPSTSYYIYDESGHVIGEYDQNGNLVQEHIYLGDKPVAVAMPNGTSATLDYVTTDQLNTPRMVTDSSGTVQWSWASDPFGNGQPISRTLVVNEHSNPSQQRRSKTKDAFWSCRRLEASGNPVQEHVYLGDRPVAVVQNNTTLDYVTTD